VSMYLISDLYHPLRNIYVLDIRTDESMYSLDRKTTRQPMSPQTPRFVV
jgi:hypothetical protein